MRPVRVANPTHKFSAPSNWQADSMGPCGDLFVRVDQIGDTGVLENVSAWRPSPQELAKLNAGGVVEIGLCTQGGQPPMRAYVVDDPDGA